MELGEEACLAAAKKYSNAVVVFGGPSARPAVVAGTNRQNHDALTSAGWPSRRRRTFAGSTMRAASQPIGVDSSPLSG
jgi:hypothetical protein